jgi:hypothetical protein
MHALALHDHVVARVLPVKREMARSVPDRGKDEVARKAQAAVRAKFRAGAGAGLDTAWNGVGEADRLEDRQDGFMDTLDIVLAERPVFAALQTWADGADVVGKRGRSQRPARFAAA